MTLISIVTRLRRGPNRYLAETRKSVRTQRPPPGWNLQWIDVEDGPAVDSRTFPGDPRIRYLGTWAQQGPAGGGNVDASCARGTWIRILDDDDILPPGALAAVIDMVERHADVLWITGEALDLTEAGPRPISGHGFAPGPLPRPAFARWLLEHDEGPLPVHPASLFVRRGAFLAVGGCSALSPGEDVEMLAALSTLFDGWHTGAPALHYRVSPQQHRRAEHRSTSFPRRVNLIRQRILAIQRLVQAQAHSGEPTHPGVDDSRSQFTAGTPAASGSADHPPLLATSGW
jgi:hypothetical protein